MFINILYKIIPIHLSVLKTTSAPSAQLQPARPAGKILARREEKRKLARPVLSAFPP